MLTSEICAAASMGILIMEQKMTHFSIVTTAKGAISKVNFDVTIKMKEDVELVLEFMYGITYSY